MMIELGPNLSLAIMVCGISAAGAFIIWCMSQ
jgi:hypothetical protein